MKTVGTRSHILKVKWRKGKGDGKVKTKEEVK